MRIKIDATAVSNSVSRQKKARTLYEAANSPCFAFAKATVDEIVKVVEGVFGVTRAEMFDMGDRGRAVMARKAVYVVAAETTKLQMKEIAYACNRTTPTVVSRAKRDVIRMAKDDPEFRNRLEVVRRRLLGEPDADLEARVEEIDRAWRVPADEVLKCVARHLKVPRERLSKPYSNYTDYRARATAMHVLMLVRDDSPAEVQRATGGSKGHNRESIIEIRGVIKRDPDYAALVSAIVAELGGPIKQRWKRGGDDAASSVEVHDQRISVAPWAAVKATVGSQLREHRLRCNVSLKRLSLLSGISERTVQRIEIGQSGDIEDLCRLAAALGCQLDVQLHIVAPVVLRTGDRRTPDLTKQEVRVLESLQKHKDRSAVAKDLGIALGTVAIHISSITMKLNVKSDGEAVSVAEKKRLLPSD